ncbi:MAG TPA: ATP-binding protein [Casimicrobiaceae bacterium]|nr:ATP-binding protein [Casimicrobiaceae bacterium]
MAAADRVTTRFRHAAPPPVHRRLALPRRLSGRIRPGRGIAIATLLCGILFAAGLAGATAYGEEAVVGNAAHLATFLLSCVGVLALTWMRVLTRHRQHGKNGTGTLRDTLLLREGSEPEESRRRPIADRLLAPLFGSNDDEDRVATARDVHRLATLYAVLTQTNETIARIRDPEELLQSVCGIAVRDGGFATAWIGLVGEDRATLRVAAAAGECAASYLGTAYALDAGRQRPPVVAVAESRHYVGNDCCDDDVLPKAPEPRWRSTAALPLYQEGIVVGVLTVYARSPDYFDAELTRLLLLLAGDVSLALESAASARRQARAEAALRQLNATLEERVRERTLWLEQANHELEAFSYSVSHDLRAPLRAISGFSNLLMEEHGAQLNDEARAYVGKVQAASARMANLIDSLLDLSRISRAPLNRARVNLSAMAEEIVAELRECEPARKVLSAVTPGQIAEVDPRLTRVVLANLLGNAWKFSAARVPAVIEFGQTTRDGLRMYYVRDNGAGFDMAHADKLFAPFQRLHSASEFAGDGIGLALVQRVVHRHGGFVAAESETDRGTTIYFSLQPEAVQ